MNRQHVEILKSQILRRLATVGDSSYLELRQNVDSSLRGRRKLYRTDWYLSAEGAAAIRELVATGKAKMIRTPHRTLLCLPSCYRGVYPVLRMGSGK